MYGGVCVFGDKSFFRRVNSYGGELVDNLSEGAFLGCLIFFLQ